MQRTENNVFLKNSCNNILCLIYDDFLDNDPLPNLPPKGKEQNLSPLGEIRKGVIINKIDKIKCYLNSEA